MEVKKIERTNRYPAFFVTKNGSVVASSNGRQFWLHSCTDTQDVDSEGAVIYYDENLKHSNGNSFQNRPDLDIESECILLNDRIKQVLCNIMQGQEFTYIGSDTRTTLNSIYEVENIQIFRDGSFCIEYYNDRNQIASICDLSEIIIRESNQNL